MPGMDGKGPRGMGPMTGGARGWCNPAGPINAGYGPNPGAYYGTGHGYPGLGYDRWGTMPGMMPGYGMGMAWGHGRAPLGHGRGMAWGRGGGRW